MRTIYLSGPMTGYPEFNYPLFNKIAAQLRAEGHKVYNPAEFSTDHEGDFPIREAFAEYCKFICEEADTIALLPGWERSKGSATVELPLAVMCGLRVMKIAGLDYGS